MIALYSIKIFCDGTSVDKSRIESIGYYPDYSDTSNPAYIAWSESKLAENTDNTTSIDNVLACNYAPILLEAPDVGTSFDPDSPRIKLSSVSLVISNHRKTLHQLQGQGVSLSGLQIRITLNQFDNSGILIGSKVQFAGVITTPVFGETELLLTCEPNSLSRKSNILKDNDIFTIGKSNNDGAITYKTLKIDTATIPAYVLYSHDGVSSFLVIGGYDVMNGNTKTRKYQIISRVSLVINYAQLVGWWMYIVNSSNDSKGEYRKVIAISEIQSINLNFEIKAEKLKYNYYQYYEGYYYEITIEGAFTEGLIVDLVSHVQFVHFNHQYKLSKLPISGNVSSLYSKADDTIVKFGDAGYNCSLQSDGSILVNTNFIIDKNTINTYTAIPCTDLALISDGYLTKWQHKAGDETLTGLFDNIYSLHCFQDENIKIPGFFSDVGASLDCNPALVNPTLFNNRIINGAYTGFIDNFKCVSKHLAAFEFSLPAIPDGLKFKKVYLGLAISSRCIKGLADSVKCIMREAEGNAKEVFTAKLTQVVNSSPVWGHLSSIPPWYCDTFSFEDFFDTDWQWKSDNSEESVRFTGLKNMALPDIDSVDKYRLINKIGLFFPRDINTGDAVSDGINFHEICVIFEHENDLTEVYV